MFNEANKAQVLELQKSCYSERVGKVYGDFEVTEVWYDWETHKQMWRLKCVLCGAGKVTHNGKDYRKGKNKGICECRAEKARLEKIAEKQKRAERKPNFQALVGKKINDWTILEYIPQKGYLVKCGVCGRETTLTNSRLVCRTPAKCTCQVNQIKYRESDWTGKKYGHLTITGYAEKHFNCICDCGNEQRAKPTFLFSGQVRSCGKCDYFSENTKTHGLSKSRIYSIWNGMNARCYNPKSHGWATYGARGIDICDEWRNDVFAFRAWALSNGYADNLSIDRIDNDKGYAPDNCRWATAKEQANNQHPKYTFKKRPPKITHKRKLVWEVNGETKSAIEWCEQYGLSIPFALYRINKKGMTPEQALTTPKHTKGRPTTPKNPPKNKKEHHTEN